MEFMKKWEYRNESRALSQGRYEIEFLNVLGREGWELVQRDQSMVPPYDAHYLFKRAIPE